MGKILKKIAPFLLITCLSLGFMACDETECTESTVVEFNGNFYRKRDNTAYTDTLSIYGINAPNDSILKDTAAIKTITLPLKLTDTETAFLFDFVNRAKASFIKDTISIFHQNNVHFISDACGCAMFFSIDSIAYTRHKIDSIAINSKDVINEPQENIQLFFR